MNTEQFKAVVRKLVQEEIKASVKPMIKEALGEIMLEQMTAQPRMGNVSKATALREASYMGGNEFDEYPTMSRPISAGANLAAMMGMETPSLGGNYGIPSMSGLNLPDAAISAGEQGQPVPIHPEQVPAAVVKAMNTDYRSFLKDMDAAAKARRPA